MTTADVLRTEQINLRLSVEEVERLKKLAADLALSPQATIRTLLKKACDEHDRQRAESGPAKPRGKR